jgi:hypothetical protein
MDIAYAGILLLTIFLVIYLGWRAIPMLAVTLAPSQIRAWFLDTAESDRIIAAAPSVRAKLADLQTLDFGVLGILAERVLWRRPVLEVVATSAEKSTFAAIVLTPNGKAAGVYFYNPLAGGGLVFTRSRSSLPEMETDNTSAKNVPGAAVDKLWTSHRRRLQALRERGQRPLSVADQAARLAAVQAYYTSAYARRARGLFLRSAPVVNFLLVVGLLLAIIAIYIWRVPAASQP